MFIGCAKEATVDEIVNLMTEANGGAEALAAVEDQVSTWDFKMKMMPPGMMEGKEEMAGEMKETEMPMTITWKKPNKIRFDVMGPEGVPVHISSFDGSSGWTSDMGQTRDMTEAELQETENTASTWLGLQGYKDMGYTLTKLPTELVEEEKYIVLQSTDKYGNVIKYYINPETHYLERLSGEMVNMKGEKEAMSMTFKDYKKVDNIAMAHTVAQYDKEGNMIWEAQLKEVKHNTGVDDSVFMRPEMTAK
jgi:outer membrane lipoprotein-sorting protein